MFQNTFPDRETIAELTAKMLWEIGAVHFRSDEPYIFTSGLASPVYIDCRKLISYPRIRAAVSDFGCATVMRDAGFEKYDVVAGGETAGIPYAAFIAESIKVEVREQISTQLNIDHHRIHVESIVIYEKSVFLGF